MNDDETPYIGEIKIRYFETPELERQDLILLRLWNCAEAKDCDRCELVKRCRWLHYCSAHKTLTAEATEEFLASFQELISKNNGQGY